MTDRSTSPDGFDAWPFERQLREFLADVDRPPQDYPTWLVFRIKERIDDLPSEVRQALLWRIRGRSRGPWRQLKRRLAVVYAVRRSARRALRRSARRALRRGDGGARRSDGTHGARRRAGVPAPRALRA